MKKSTNKQHLIEAYSTALNLNAEEKGLPESIQWMPPGEHTITAKRNGKPATVKVLVDAAAAEAIKKSFSALIESGRSPYLDFNHSGGEASAKVLDVFWGGEDPKRGGVRAKIEWSAAGEAAIKGRSYSSFSPTFFIDDKTGRISGTTTNMGGLVNEPAFQRISSIMGRAAGHETNETNTMDKLLQALVSAKLITSADMTDEEAAAAFSAAFAPIQAKAAEADSFKTKLEAAEATIKKAAHDRAESIVQAACMDGRLAPKDEAARKFWTDSIITAGASAEAALAGLTPNPAFKAQVKVEAKDAAGADGADEASKIKARSAKQDSAIKAYRAEHPQASFGQAWEACAAEDPETFKA